MELINKTEILLPKNEDMQKWAVVSCDQFTSQRKYWDALKQVVGGSNSTLKLIFPEIYLEDGDAEERIKNINAEMLRYLEDGVFKSLNDSFVLVKRDTAFGTSTLGIVLGIDLEKYSFLPVSDARIRATEGFVPDRIPPRLKIRENADIELPHIILLVDDRKAEFIEPFYENKDKYEKLYDFTLNMSGGHVEGFKISADEVISSFKKFEKSVDGIYGVKTDFIMAVGDGNHSLATAKTHWDMIKGKLSEDERKTHPARFALCEVQNLHSGGLKFEPIYRFVFGVDDGVFVEYLKTKLKGEGELELFSKANKYKIAVNANSAEAIYDIQKAIDGYIEVNQGVTVDYIHGTGHLAAIANDEKGVAILMPKIKKEELFGYILEHGALCRKAFSMGEAEGKRYYLEAKKIR